MSIARYDLTEDCTTGKVDITPVPETMEGRYVSYDDYAALEAKCAALAAENAGLKSAVIERKSLSEEIRKAGRPPHTDFWHQSIYMADKKVDDALNSTPATDAFLAEVRAQGVKAFASVLEERGKHHEYVEIANAYAALLRKGVQS